MFENIEAKCIGEVQVGEEYFVPYSIKHEMLLVHHIFNRK